MGHCIDHGIEDSFRTPSHLKIATYTTHVALLRIIWLLDVISILNFFYFAKI